MSRARVVAALVVVSLILSAEPEAAHAGSANACDHLATALSPGTAGPTFLASYPTATAESLVGVAFLYDNAVATLALVACGRAGQAQRIGDAMLAAQARDRYWHDGRLRNGYLAGTIGPGPVRLAGWWDARQKLWVEDRYQAGSDTGNMAWAILALLALDRATEDHRYRAGAERLGVWLQQWRSDGTPGGFTGGTFAHEPAPVVQTWKSTEHNTDLVAAFTGLARATGDQKWLVEASAAHAFVNAMWRAECSCFAAGTASDGKTRNTLVALDAQTWPLLALPNASVRFSAAIAPRALRAGDGFAYSEAQSGLWTEGTAQVALLLTLSGRHAEAAVLLRALQGMRTPGGSYYAADTAGLATGFMLETDPTKPRQYSHIEHLAAVSWVALAEQGYNPFTGSNSLPDGR